MAGCKPVVTWCATALLALQAGGAQAQAGAACRPGDPLIFWGGRYGDFLQHGI